MIAELARLSLGRVLLHFIAMLRDGAVRFHAAGIARELSWVVGGAAPLLARVHAGLIGALALYLTQPGKRYRPLTTADPQSLAAVLLHGDVLLTEGNTRMASLVKLITRSPWSHVSMYVGPLEAGPDPRCIVEADIAAGVRAVPLSELEGLRVRVLRAAGLRDTDRRRVAEWVVSRIGDQYDLAHAWALARRFLGLPSAHRLPPPAPTTIVQGVTRFICSSLVAQAFGLVGYQIVPPRTGVPEVWADHRCVVPRDFENASLFEVVSSPPRLTTSNT